jgi:hypothetical protein
MPLTSAMQEYARRFVQSVELMSVLCRESQTDEVRMTASQPLATLCVSLCCAAGHSVVTCGTNDQASLDEVLSLACTDLEMDDGGYATSAELKAYKLEVCLSLIAYSS